MNKEDEQKLRELIGSNPNEQYTFEGNDITFIKEMTVNVNDGGKFYNSAIPKPKKNPSTTSTELSNKSSGTDKENSNLESKEIIDRLKNVCYGDVNVATTFLQQVKGLKNTEIIVLVAEYLKARKISELSAHRDLWQILHDNNLYTASESNWNIALKKY